MVRRARHVDEHSSSASPDLQRGGIPRRFERAIPRLPSSRLFAGELVQTGPAGCPFEGAGWPVIGDSLLRCIVDMIRDFSQALPGLSC